MPKFKFALQIYGCQMNIADAQRVAGVSTSLGGKRTEDESKADVVVFCTCSVRQKGEERVKGKVAQLRKTHPHMKIGLTGCMLHYGEKKLRKMMPGLDFVFRIEDNWKLADVLGINEGIVGTGFKPAPTLNNPSNYFSLAPEIDSEMRAYVPIMNGCDNFCSYCIVPYARGREWSQGKREVLAEIEKLLNDGYKEIFLLGQNVNSYKCPETETNFPELLREIDKLGGGRKWWLRFTSPHPKDLSDDLVKCFAKLKNLTPWMHLPIQAGSDRIIKLMNRHYTVEKFAELVLKLRKARPDISISTDVIVGFPGETREDFEQTIKAFARFEFDFIFLARYSPRPGTAAARMDDDVSPAEKEKRWHELNEVQRVISRKKFAELVGQEVEILVDKVEDDWAEGKTIYMQNVRLSGAKKARTRVGDFVKGKVTRGRDWAAEGEIGK